MRATTADDLDRLHHVTANFFFWQGLRWVPLGAAMIALVGLSSPALPIGAGARLSAQLSVLAGALWLSGVAGRWYRRHFGRVRGIPGAHTRRDIVKWLVVYPAIVVALVVDGRWAPPVFVSALALAAATLAYRYSTGGGRRHYVALAAMMAAFGLLPLTGAVPAGRPLFGPFVGILGAVYVIGGVLDHLELVRLLRPAPHDHGADDDARAV